MSTSALLSFDATKSTAPITQPPGQTKPIPKQTKTGTVSFEVPGTDIKAETWYSLWGDLSSSTVPLICLHGGPGMAHNYIKPVVHLSSAPSTRPVILYDQLGCGNSTHLRDKYGDNDFWTPELFMAELDNLIARLGIGTFDLFGQSWGGMLGAQYATNRPAGLRRLVIADSPSDMVTWVQVATELRKTLPQDVQAALTRGEESGDYESKAFETAMQAFNQRFLCRIVPLPKELVETTDAYKDDNTVYMTMNGPSEFTVIGGLKHWDLRPKLKQINVPTLLVNGKYDEAQDVVMQPFFDAIEKVKWVRFAESSHTPHLEETDSFIMAMSSFLDS